MDSDLLDSFPAWVEWAATMLQEKGDSIPAVDDWIPGVPWQDAVHRWARGIADDGGAAEREKAFRAFSSLQAGRPYKLPERFASLTVAHALVSELRRVESDSYLGDMLREEDYPRLAEAIEELQQDFADLVRLVRPEDCPRSWPAISWEICNSYLVGDVSRVFDLLQVVPGLNVLPSADLLVLRGHIRFLSVFDERAGETLADRWEYAGAIWPFGTLGRSGFIDGDYVNAALLFTKARCGEGPIDLKPDLRSAVRDVIADLEKAVDQGASLGVEHRMALGRCYFETARYAEAARHYESVLAGEGLKTFAQRFGKADKQKAVMGMRQEAARCLATALRRAGDNERAKATLRSNLDAFEDRRQGLRELAKVQAVTGDFQGAYESLREASESDPKGTDDWLESTVLALGGIATSRDLARQIERLFDENKPLGRALEKLVATYWPRFTTLCPEAKDEWRKGVLYCYWPSLTDELRLVVRKDSVRHFAIAVEKELEARVFAQFRNVQQAEVRPSRASGEKSDPLEAYLAMARPLTLGQMASALCRAKTDLERKLVEWVRRQHPNLLMSRERLRDIVALRNPTAHGGATGDADPSDAEKWCRVVLDGLGTPGS